MSKAQAVILAGGKGSRLYPYTKVLPKPLVPLENFPIAEIIIRQLKHYGFKNIVMATGHMADLIKSYFGNGSRWGVSIRYVQEEQALGTAGVIKLITGLEDDFFVINGDTFTNINLKKMMTFHRSKNADATIAIKERVVRTDFGVVQFNGTKKLLGYVEKPEHKSFVSTGINILNKSCKKYIQRGEFIGMPDLMLRSKEAGKDVFCYPMNKDIWLDLGRPEDFQRAQDVLKKNRKKFVFLK